MFALICGIRTKMMIIIIIIIIIIMGHECKSGADWEGTSVGEGERRGSWGDEED
jgi:hypothetical protein